MNAEQVAKAIQTRKTAKLVGRHVKLADDKAALVGRVKASIDASQATLRVLENL